MAVLGVDARGRAPFWTVLVEAGQVERVVAREDPLAAVDAPERVEVVAVDVPLGHEDPAGEGDGERACDAAARRLLGEARDRVYPLPPPAALAADSYHDALERCRRNGWPHLEPPLWFARERLAELNRRWGGDERLVEVHPEVSFAVANGREGEPAPLERYGDAWAALHERLEVLHRVGLHPEGHLEDRDEPDPRPVLDACAAAWSAARVADSRARRLPADPPRDPRTGRAVAIHA